MKPFLKMYFINNSHFILVYIPYFHKKITGLLRLLSLEPLGAVPPTPATPPHSLTELCLPVPWVQDTCTQTCLVSKPNTPLPQPRLMKEVLKNIFLGPYTCGKCLGQINHSKHPFVWQVSGLEV